jgi:hypothetical protein
VGHGHCTTVIPAFGRVRQEDQEFEASLSYMAKPYLKTTITKTTTTTKKKRKQGKPP